MTALCFEWGMGAGREIDFIKPSVSLSVLGSPFCMVNTNLGSQHPEICWLEGLRR